MNSKIKVLITGVGGAGTLGREIVKSYQMLPNEYDITITNSNQIDLYMNNQLKQYLIPLANSPNFIENLLKLCKDDGIQVIIPGSEPETEIISKNRDLFSDNGIVALTNTHDLVKLCSDKLKLTNFLESKKILTPKIFSYDEISETNFPEYPLLIKPIYGSGSRNVFVAEDFEELSFFRKFLLKQNITPIIQEFIPGIDNEFTIGLIYCNEGKLSTSIAMRRNLNGGLSTRSIINSKNNESLIISSGISQGYFDDFPEIRKKAVFISSILKSDGPLNIQCRIKDDELYIFEINPRFSGTTYSRALVGCNEPDILTKFRLMGKTPESFEYKRGYVMKDFTEKFIPENMINNK